MQVENNLSSSAKVRIANGDITAEELEQLLTKGD